MARRVERLQASIHRGVARELQSLFPKQQITVTEVELASDGKFAVVWVSILNKGDREQLFAQVEASRGRLRAAISKEAELRRLPQIELRLDLRAEQIQRLDRLTRGSLSDKEEE